MELQTIDIAAVTSTFVTYQEHEDAKSAAETSLSGLGDKPALPQYVAAESDYSGVVDSRNGWESDKAEYEEAIASRTILLSEQEDLILEKLPPNTWVRIDLDPEGAHDYYWLGYNTNSATGYTEYLRVTPGATEPVTPLTHNMDAE